MNQELVQDIRYKLQKRVRALNSIDYQYYQPMLRRFWRSLQEVDILKAIVESLLLEYPEYSNYTKVASLPAGILQSTETYEQHAALCLNIIQACAVMEDSSIFPPIVGRILNKHINVDVLIPLFHSLVVEPVYEYIDEQLDDQRAILATIRRFKHKAEWFRHAELYRLWDSKHQSGEKQLALKFYEFLFDQGISFSIEPSSVSGEIDLIAAQEGDDPLLADAKIFDPDSGKGVDYLARAVNQIYIYSQDYNQPFGYLIIFKTCEYDLKFALTNVGQDTPFFVHNNKTIFFVVIDIYPHERSASKRGKLRSYEITEDNLLQIISEERSESS